ncbi:MAG: glycosyltransferase family 9 protein [Candidatus Hydrogenedentes bacterium]|nr:glycosyltransferase family 9 protein [Candidatus Hydrogenedentota bacterium]
MSVTEQHSDADFLRRIFPPALRPLAADINPESVLFAPGWGLGLGDQCMCVPLVRLLKRRFPDAHLCVLTSYPEFWECSGITGAEFVPLDPNSAHQISEYVGQFDVAIVGYFPGSLDTLSMAGKPIAFAAGGQLMQYRCFYADTDRRGEIPLESCRVTVCEAHKFLSLFADIGVCTRDEYWEALSNLDSVDARDSRTRGRRVLICPAAAQLYKEWPAARWSDLAEDLVRNGASVTVSSGMNSREASVAERIASGHPGIDLMPPQSLGCFMESLSEFDLVISGDTSVQHLVSFLGRPVSLTIYGPTDPLRFCPPTPNCFHLAPSTLSRAEARDGVLACFALMAGEYGHVAHEANALSLKSAALQFVEACRLGAQATDGAENSQDYKVRIRELRRLLRPESRLFCLGCEGQLQRVFAVFERAQPLVAIQYLRQSSAYRMARWIVSHG